MKAFATRDGTPCRQGAKFFFSAFLLIRKIYRVLVFLCALAPWCAYFWRRHFNGLRVTARDLHLPVSGSRSQFQLHMRPY